LNTEEASAEELAHIVEAVVQRQREIGIHIVNDGEHAKRGNWLSFANDRFAGFEAHSTSQPSMITRGKDRDEFADFYRYATERGTLFYMPARKEPIAQREWVCTGPITYCGAPVLQREIDLLKAAVGDQEAFLTTTAPGSLECYRANRFYKSQEEFLYAFADALRIEYEMIADAGLLVQIDDAWLPALWDRIGMQMGLDAFRKYCLVRIEALNHALRNIPEDRIRYHVCWGSWHGPHAYDLEMRDFVDMMLRVNARAYLFEAANARHEHEYVVWEHVKLPEGKILVPGVVTHSTDVVEHPELVSQRIQRFARLVGTPNVIAGTDCGFGGRSHPQVAWAKLKSLVEGARRASEVLR
jgi:5-methyltetrahydropteroyltriglutamate--homocysteine methyltransferase